MSEFRHKPVKVDAIRVRDVLKTWDQANKGEIKEETPKWIDKAYKSGHLIFASEYLLVSTKEGPVRAEKADWIVRKAKGDLCTCTRDEFDETYEPDEPKDEEKDPVESVEA